LPRPVWGLDDNDEAARDGTRWGAASRSLLVAALHLLGDFGEHIGQRAAVLRGEPFPDLSAEPPEDGPIQQERKPRNDQAHPPGGIVGHRHWPPLMDTGYTAAARSKCDRATTCRKGFHTKL